jgi:DNA replication and repair protein RecF
MEFITQKTGQRPALLLDDIFSELDRQRRKHLLEVIPRQQTIITTTDLHLVEPEVRKKMEVIKLV